MKESTGKKMQNRHQSLQYRNLTEKFARLNQSKLNSMKKSDQFGKTNAIKEHTFGSFTDKLTTDVPLIYTQEDRRMMREELQKEIIKREMDIIERRSRKSVIYLPTKSLLENNMKTMVYPSQKKPLIIRPATMIYGKFTVADMERLKNIYQNMRTNKRLSRDYLKPYEMEGEYYIDSSIDISFRKIKKNYTEFLIWRVANNTITPVPREQYGTFYTQDAYLIYAASIYGCPSGIQQLSKEVRGIEYHVHFWLGDSVTAEQAGTVAYKTVELDTLLGGYTIQHREVQGFESPRFKSYFRNGIRILLGGNPVKFQYCDDVFNPRLYRIKGVSAPIVTQLIDINWEQFNSGDVFILHTDTIMFVWIGRAATATEKSFAIIASKDLHQEWQTTNTVFVDDGYEKTMNEDDRAVFELYLPLSERVVKSVNQIDDDNEKDVNVDKKSRAHVKLYKCCEVKGKYRVSEIRTGPLNQDELLSTDVFILDHEETGIWVWVGKEVRDKEHADAIRNARGFVKKKKYKSGTPVTRVVDTAEPFEFKMLFVNWQDKVDSKLLAHGQKIPVIKVTKFDANTMRDRPAFAAKSQLVDDGTGILKIWRCKRNEAIEMPKDSHGTFFNGDCYILLYTYDCGETRYIIYYWIGAHCVPDEQDTMIEKCRELEENLINVVLVRVCDGKEPPHFLQILKGRLKIFQGKGIEIDVSGMNTKTPKSFLLKVHGTATYNTKAIQVAPRASSLNSNHCYVLRKNNNTIIWCGNYSTGDNREMAKLFAGVDFILILETHETEDFWNCLGGKRNFSMTPKISDPLLKTVLPARLFKCYMIAEQFKADEIVHYIQKDLSPECILLLDGGNVIYIWVGSYCSKEDYYNQSFELIKEYLKNDTRGRDIKITFVRVKQGFEPPTFTGFFDIWNKKCWLDYKSYEEHRAEIEKEDSYFLQRYSHGECSTDFDTYDKYGVSILRGSVESLPNAVDPLNKELHLTYDDFVSLFKMEYQDFEKLPMWKRQELKKNVGLF